MKRWIGRWLVGVGVVHTVFGAVVFAQPLREIGRDGLWNAVDGYPGRQLAFWFTLAGPLFLLTGALTDWVEAREDGAVPRFLGPSLLALGISGVILMPASGFWLFLPPAVAASRRAARGRGRAGMEAPSTGENTPGGSSAPHPNPAGRLEPRRAQAPGHSRE